MGNCMNSWRLSDKEEDRKLGGKSVKGSGFGKSGNLSVKIVLTKEELGWLTLQLNSKDRRRNRLEDVLGEIVRGRRQAAEERWKPSLERITEGPELLEMHR
ncbi:hypothetical protein Nepgr_011177 [Nepenthes gracilis]|uniref:Uncharacterized protein n=1 Tax=Nepenthes gracilis TaxID=150966 RepID=A0AAD3SEP3_NEPGR|nr:hypothetical protein Nepgr_011177 [Nepenthes gracilis]